MIKHILSFLLLISMLSGCSLPRITILGDALTPQEHLQLAYAYEKKEKNDLAIEEYTKAAKEIPEAYLYLGNLYFTMKQWSDAEKAYKKAIRQLPDNPRPYNNLAWLLYTRNKRLPEAEQLALKAVSLAQDKDKEMYLDTLKSIQKARNTSGSISVSGAYLCLDLRNGNENLERRVFPAYP